MISELISCRPIVKILIYHFITSILVTDPFSEISGKFPKSSRKFPGNFSEFPQPPYPPPTLGTHPYISTPYPYLFITKINPKTSNRFFLHCSFLVQFPVFSFTLHMLWKACSWWCITSTTVPYSTATGIIIKTLPCTVLYHTTNKAQYL